MKDLLIFGDSFGEEMNVTFPTDHPMHKFVHSQISYHSILRNSGYFKSVTSYAMGGASLWSQFKLFKEKYKGNEQVLWFLTDPSRFTITYTEQDDYVDTEIRMTGLPVAEYLLKEAEKENKVVRTRVLKSAIDYMIHMQDREEDVYKHIKILEDIENTVGSDLTVIDSFKILDKTKFSIQKHYEAENKILCDGQDMYHTLRLFYYDLRRNHMINENHHIFARKLLDKMLTGKDIDGTGFIKPKRSDFDKYFRKK